MSRTKRIGALVVACCAIVAWLNHVVVVQLIRSDEAPKLEVQIEYSRWAGDFKGAINAYESYRRQYGEPGSRFTIGDAAWSYYKVGRREAALVAAYEVVEILRSETRWSLSRPALYVDTDWRGPVVIGLVANDKGGLSAASEAFAQMQLPEDFMAAVRLRFERELRVELAMRATIAKVRHILEAVLGLR